MGGILDFKFKITIRGEWLESTIGMLYSATEWWSYFEETAYFKDMFISNTNLKSDIHATGSNGASFCRLLDLSLNGDDDGFSLEDREEFDEGIHKNLLKDMKDGGLSIVFYVSEHCDYELYYISFSNYTVTSDGNRFAVREEDGREDSEMLHEWATEFCDSQRSDCIYAQVSDAYNRYCLCNNHGLSYRGVDVNQGFFPINAVIDDIQSVLDEWAVILESNMNFDIGRGSPDWSIRLSQDQRDLWEHDENEGHLIPYQPSEIDSELWDIFMCDFISLSKQYRDFIARLDLDGCDGIALDKLLVSMFCLDRGLSLDDVIGILADYHDLLDALANVYELCDRKTLLYDTFEVCDDTHGSFYNYDELSSIQCFLDDLEDTSAFLSHLTESPDISYIQTLFEKARNYDFTGILCAIDEVVWFDHCPFFPRYDSA